jgi:protein-S-isoprenylcysteine O-methyltransferase Ste14
LSAPRHDDRRPFSRFGETIFRHRTAIPLPLAIALLVIPSTSTGGRWHLSVGIAVVLAAEALRLWAVRHIGAISRTRSDRLGPLIASGPFAFVRNPLYLANIALWVGLALVARLAWLAPVFLAVLGLEYAAIVAWEEELLNARRGDEYRAYAARVRRWLPTGRPSAPINSSAGSKPPLFSWRETLFSERGTLIAIGVGFLLLWIKSRVWIANG